MKEVALFGDGSILKELSPKYTKKKSICSKWTIQELVRFKMVAY